MLPTILALQFHHEKNSLPKNTTTQLYNSAASNHHQIKIYHHDHKPQLKQATSIILEQPHLYKLLPIDTMHSTTFSSYTSITMFEYKTI